MLKVLLVDDSSFQRKIIKSTLVFAGCKVFEANNGREALVQLQNNDIELIISDLVMPELNGYELLKYLKQKNIAIPVIIITSDIQVKTAEKTRMLGALAVLKKPVDKLTLLEVIYKITKKDLLHDK